MYIYIFIYVYVYIYMYRGFGGWDREVHEVGEGRVDRARHQSHPLLFALIYVNDIYANFIYVNFIYVNFISLLLQRESSFIDNLVVRIHYTIVMVKWTGLAPWEFEGSPAPSAPARANGGCRI